MPLTLGFPARRRLQEDLAGCVFASSPAGFEKMPPVCRCPGRFGCIPPACDSRRTSPAGVFGSSSLGPCPGLALGSCAVGLCLGVAVSPVLAWLWGRAPWGRAGRCGPGRRRWRPGLCWRAWLGAAVYPRVCGGSRFFGWERYICTGLSPRVRGIRFVTLDATAVLRSIPACAGDPVFE